MKVCIWLTVSGEYGVPQGQLMFHQGKVLTGDTAYHAPPIGMEEPAMDETTIGELRTEYGLGTELKGFNNERKAWLYTDDNDRGDGSNSLTMVLVEWPHNGDDDFVERPPDRCPNTGDTYGDLSL